MICRRNPKERPPLKRVVEAQARVFGSVSGNWYSRGVQRRRRRRRFSALSETADAVEGKNGGYRFGDFLLAVDGGALTSAGSAASAKRVDSTGNFEDTGAKLYLPQCGESTNHSFGSSTDMDAIIKAMREAGVSRLDSGALSNATSHSSDVMTALKAAGIDLNAMGSTSWSFNSNMLYWTTADIANIPSGTKVPVMRYNPSSGTYTVWSATVTQHTEPRIGTYNMIEKEKSQYGASAQAGKEKQTYEMPLK